MNARWIFLIVLLVLLAAAAAVLWLGTPRLEEVSPADQSADVPAGAAIRLRFSRPMQADSVAERLTLNPFRTGQVSAEGNEVVFTPDSAWQAGESVTASLESGARAAGLFQLPLPGEHSWSFTIRRPRLAYLYPFDRAANIYQLDPANGETRQLTENQSGVLDFDIDSRGETLIYSSYVGDSGSAIYSLDLTTPDAAPLSILDCPQALCTAPRVAPGNDFLAYERTAFPGKDAVDYPQVWLLSISDQQQEPQEPVLIGNPLHQTLEPHWSPGGLLTYYDSTQEAFILLDPRSSERSERREIANQTGLSGSWSPDGQAYIVPEILDNPTVNPAPDPATFPVVSSHLLRFNLDGSQQDLTIEEELEDTAPAFSPDGSWLAFARKYLTLALWTPGRQIWLMRLDGTQARQVTNTPDYNHYNLAWSPDGGRIAYSRFNQNAPTDPPEIWLVDLGSGIETQLVIGGYAPRWIP